MACNYVLGCSEPAEPGPCKARFERWYFDSNTTTCRRFIYGGCRGNNNNFETKLECRRKCSPVKNTSNNEFTSVIST
uniref:BPTI/Kunitz inhibitor domain-containing protein n=1 Tax=Amblyomma maculatum TaxID=34609 RepID=G3MQF8_AMBMU